MKEFHVALSLAGCISKSESNWNMKWEIFLQERRLEPVAVLTSNTRSPFMRYAISSSYELFGVCSCSTTAQLHNVDGQIHKLCSSPAFLRPRTMLCCQIALCGDDVAMWDCIISSCKSLAFCISLHFSQFCCWCHSDDKKDV